MFGFRKTAYKSFVAFYWSALIYKTESVDSA